MNKLKFLPAFLLISLLAACSNGIDEGNKVTTPAAPTGNQVGATQPTQQPASGTAGLNPAHGQPGHRCDIQVGAPLNSAPAQPANTTAPGVTVNPAPATAPASTGSQAGLNPAHGQPGHRCDIAVGAPLNSKPAQ
jgi:hypothetical protein